MMSLNASQLAENLDNYAQSLGRSGVVVNDHWNDVSQQWRGLVDRLDAEWIRQLEPVIQKTGQFFNEYTGMTKRLEEHLRQSADKIRHIDA